jgi:hypothetical protein
MVHLSGGGAIITVVHGDCSCRCARDTGKCRGCWTGALGTVLLAAARERMHAARHLR